MHEYTLIWIYNRCYTIINPTLSFPGANWCLPLFSVIMLIPWYQGGVLSPRQNLLNRAELVAGRLRRSIMGNIRWALKPFCESHARVSIRAWLPNKKLTSITFWLDLSRLNTNTSNTIVLEMNSKHTDVNEVRIFSLLFLQTDTLMTKYIYIYLWGWYRYVYIQTYTDI